MFIMFNFWTNININWHITACITFISHDIIHIHAHIHICMYMCICMTIMILCFCFHLYMCMRYFLFHDSTDRTTALFPAVTHRHHHRLLAVKFGDVFVSSAPFRVVQRSEATHHLHPTHPAPRRVLHHSGKHEPRGAPTASFAPHGSNTPDRRNSTTGDKANRAPRLENQMTGYFFPLDHRRSFTVPTDWTLPPPTLDHRAAGHSGRWCPPCLYRDQLMD